MRATAGTLPPKYTTTRFLTPAHSFPIYRHPSDRSPKLRQFTATVAQIREHVVAVAGPGPVLAEAGHLTHAAWTDLATDLTLQPDKGTIARLRRIKDDGELARMALAASIADDALAAVAPILADSPTEAEVRDELEHRMRRLGADGPSYDTIVASGPDNAARPHHETGRRTIVEGDTVIIDVGALVDGYHSDMTRSFVVGEPTPDQQHVYDLLLEIQLAGLAAVRAGVAARDVDAACRSMAKSTTADGTPMAAALMKQTGQSESAVNP